MRAALLMLGSTMAFGLMAVAIRYATRYVPTQEVAFFRNAFGLLALLPMLLRPGHAPLKTQQLPRYFVRSAIGLGSMLCAFWALGHLPLAQAVSLSYSTPLFVTIAAVLWLGETVRVRRWAAVVVGFIGVLVIVRPGAEGFNQAALLALASVGFCTVRDLATRRIPKDLPTVFITLLTTVTVTTAGAAVLVPLGGWRPPSGQALGLLTFAAVLILIRYQCIIVSLRTGDISAVAPFRYTALLWAMLTGYLTFGHKPDGAMLAGATIIVASGLYAFYRERKRDKLRPAATGPGLPPDGL